MPQLGETGTSKSGRPMVYTPAGWAYVGGGSKSSGSDPSDPNAIKAGAEQRGRVNLSLNPAITAMNTTIDMEEIDRDPKRRRKVPNNPFSDEPIAHAEYMKAMGQENTGPLKRQVFSAMAGNDFNEEMNAYKQMESSLMPMFAGSAVTLSEAQRFLQANIPQPEDSANTIRAKRLARKQLVNGAAAMINAPPPYPEVGAWGTRTATLPGATGPLAGTSPLRRPGGPAYNPRTQAPSQPRNIARPRNEAEFNRLPVGAQYVNPADGKVYTKVR
jgi:hypothetical protein